MEIEIEQFNSAELLEVVEVPAWELAETAKYPKWLVPIWAAKLMTVETGENIARIGAHVLFQHNPGEDFVEMPLIEWFYNHA